MFAVSDYFRETAGKNSRYVDIKCSIEGVDYTDITELNINRSVSNEDEFQIGVLVSGRLNIKIRNVANIQSHSLCIPYVRFSTDFGKTYTEWCPLGKYYVDNRYYSDGIVSITAYDMALNLDNIYDSKLEYPTTFREIINDIAASKDFECDIEFDDIPVEIKPIDYTERELIQYCAGCHGAAPFFDNSGRLKFNNYSVNSEKIDILNATAQSIDDQAYVIRKIDCVKNKDITYTAGKSDGDYSTVSFANPFMTNEQFIKYYEKLTGFRYYKASIEKASFGYYEPGDAMECFDTSNTANTATIIISEIEITFSAGELFKETINSNARNPSDNDYVKTNDIESAIKNETKELQEAVYYFENENILTIGNESNEIIRMRFTANSDCTPLFNAGCIFKIDTPGVLDFEYIIDNTKWRVEPRHSVIEGWCTLHLFLPLYKIKGNQSHEIVVYVKSDEATGIINRSQIQAAVNGQGLEVVQDEWDGTIQVITEVALTAINRINVYAGVRSITASVLTENNEPVNSNFGASAAPVAVDPLTLDIGISGISAGLAFARVIVYEQIKFNYLTKQLFIYNSKYLDFRENDMTIKTEYVFDNAVDLEIDNGCLQELSLDIEQFKHVEQIILEVE